MSRRDGIPWDTEARRTAGNQWGADQPAFTHRVDALTHARCCFSSVRSVPLWFISGGLVVLLGGGGAAAWFFSQPDDSPREAEEKLQKAPVYLALETFTVNLQDSEQYMQIDITLQVPDQVQADAIKLHMPRVRSRLLTLLSSRH